MKYSSFSFRKILSFSSLLVALALACPPTGWTMQPNEDMNVDQTPQTNKKRKCEEGQDAEQSDANQSRRDYYERGVLEYFNPNPDLKKAAKYFKDAVREGDEASLIPLTIMYINGEGVKKNEQKALKCFSNITPKPFLNNPNCRESFERSLVLAFIELCENLKRSVGSRFTVALMSHYERYFSKDLWDSTFTYLDLLDGGFALAQQQLDLIYEDLARTKYSLTFHSNHFDNWNSKERIRFLHLLADQGNSAAQHDLGKKYFMGTGCEKNLEKGLRYLKLASDNGNQDASYIIWEDCTAHNGNLSDSQDVERYSKRVAKQGNTSWALRWAQKYASWNKPIKAAKYYAIVASCDYDTREKEKEYYEKEINELFTSVDLNKKNSKYILNSMMLHFRYNDLNRNMEFLPKYSEYMSIKEDVTEAITKQDDTLGQHTLAKLYFNRALTLVQECDWDNDAWEMDTGATQKAILQVQKGLNHAKLAFQSGELKALKTVVRGYEFLRQFYWNLGDETMVLESEEAIRETQAFKKYFFEY